MRQIRIFGIASVLCLAVICACAQAANSTLGSASAAVSSTAAGGTADYTLACKIANRNGMNISTVNGLVTITFPVGTNASTIDQINSTFAGTKITTYTLVSATKITFRAPANVAKKTSFTTVLKGITNPATPGSYTASIVAVNSSGGTDTGNNIFSYTITAGGKNKLAFKVQPSNSASGAQIFPAVQVLIQDSLGNTITNSSDSITISINSGTGGALSGTTTLSAINGVATFTNLVITGTVGAFTLKANDALLPNPNVISNSFNLLASTANRVVFTVQPPLSTTAGVAMAPGIQVTIEDSAGNPITTATNAVTIALETNPGSGTLSGTTTVNAVAGVATFSNLSINKVGAGYALSASCAGTLSASSSLFTITAAAASQLGFVVQPTDTVAGDSTNNPNPVTPALQVAIQDPFGNTVTGATNAITIGFGNNPGGSSITGTNGVSAVNGIATFSNININKVGTGYTLTAAVGGLTTGTSTAFNVIADNASQVVFTANPVNTQQNAQIFPAVQVSQEDPEGNIDLTATDSITVGVGANPGGITTVLSGTAIVTAVNGVASFGNLSINNPGTGYTLTASDGVTTGTSSAFNITAGAANHLVFLAQPSSVASGSNFNPTLQVAVTSSAGATVTADNATQITIAIGSNPAAGTLGGTVTQTVSGGLATFSNVTIDKAGAGYTLTASGTGGVLPTTSSAFTVTAGALDHFSFGAIGAQSAGNAFNVTITALDVNGNTVTAYVGPVLLTSSGTLLNAPLTSDSFTNGVLPQSVVVTSVQGSTTITATDPSTGKTGTSGTFAVTAGTLNNFFVEAAGGGAIGTQTAGTAFNIQITARDAYNNTVLTYSSPVQLTSGNATLNGSPINTASLVNGVLSSQSVTITSVQAGTTITCAGMGVYGSSNAFVVQNAPPQYVLAYSTPPSNTSAGASIFPAVQVRINDQFGNLVSSATDTITLGIGSNPGGATLSGTKSVAAIGGIATFSDLSLDLAGVGYTLLASGANANNSGLSSAGFNITASVGNHLSFTVQPGTSTAGSAISPALQVAIKDASGNTVTAATDTISLAIGSGSVGAVLSGTTSHPAVNGIATFSGLSLNLTGSYTLVASSATVPSSGTSAAFSVNAGSLHHFLVESNGGGAIPLQTAGTAFNIQITAQDSNNNTVPSYTGPVALTSTGVLSGSPVTSGAFSNGILATQLVAITSAQAATTITATDAGTSKAGTSASFTVSPGALAGFVVQNITGGSIVAQTAGTAFNVKIKAVDANNNIVTGFTSTVQLSSSGTLSGAPVTSAAFTAGVLATQAVTVNSAQSNTTLTAFASGKSGTSNTFTVNPGAAAQVAFLTQPSDVQLGASIFPAVQVAIEDAQGNVVTSASTQVTLTKVSGPGTLTGSVGVAAVNGIATFGNLSCTLTGTYTLMASDSSHTVNSSSFAVTSSTANHLVFSVSPSNAQSGATISPAVKVAVTNSVGATVTTDSTSVVTIAIGNNPGSGTLSGTVSATVSAGIATFNSLTIDKVGTGYTLTASASALSPGTSSTFNITPATVSHFLIETAGGGNIPSQTAATAFNIRITALDSGNNVDTSFTGTVNISSSATLTQGAGTTAAFTAGVLSSTSVTISNTGTFTLNATATAGVQTGISNSFTVNPGALDHFLVESAGGGAIAAQTAGAGFNIRITAKDLNNNTVTGFSGPVQITSNAALTGTPVTSATFTAGVLASQSVTITSAQSGTTLSASASGKSGASAGFTVNGAALDHFLVEAAGGGALGTQAAGTPFNIQIKAQDFFNNIAASFNGSVQITSSGTLAGTSVTSATFSSGVLTSQAVTINSIQGATTLTATDSGSGKTGTSANFAVIAGPANSFLVEAAGGGAIGTQTAGTAFSIRITALDAANNTAVSFSGTVQLSSSGTLTGAPVTSGAFTNGILASQSVSVTSAQSNTTLTATASGKTGTSATFTVNPAALSTFLVEAAGGGAIPPQAVTVPFNIQITAQDAFGNTVTSFASTVDLTSNGVLAGAPVTTPAFTAGVLDSQSVTITVAQVSTTLSATDALLDAGTSVPFSVAGAAASLSFSVQPSNTNAGASITPAVKVSVVDALGSVVPTATNSITLAFANNPGSGTLTGTTTAAAVKGVASFANLSIDKIGNGYTLQASAAGITSATSAVFNISNAAAPSVTSPLSAQVTSGTVGVPVQFTFAASGALSVTYTFDFGDGTVVTTSSTSQSHTYTAPGTYTVTATATDPNGVATTSTITFQVVAPATAPGGLCDGLNPLAFGPSAFKASVRFPSPSGKDSLALSTIVQLNAGFAPTGQVVQWVLAGVTGTATLDAKGNFNAGGVKVSIRYKKPAKGAPFAGGPGKLTIAMAKVSLTTLNLNGIPDLNVDSKGTSATVDLCVLLQNSQAYQKLGGSGQYKAKKGKNGSFSGKF